MEGPMRGGQRGAETFTGVVAFAVGVFLLVTAVPRGAVANSILGALFTLQGIISVVVPRLLPHAPALSDEQARARRVAVTVLPTGALYILAALALLIALPAHERGGLTALIAVALLILGALNVLSGFGARKRVQRADPPQLSELRDETAE